MAASNVTNASPLKSSYSRSIKSENENLKQNVWESGGEFENPIPDPGGEPWEVCYRLVRNYDKKTCDAWRDEVDKLLIFAGLFSAAVTSFSIESYKLLQSNPDEIAVQLLSDIFIQLNSAGNFTSTSLTDIQKDFSPEASAVRINIFWFLSLTLSLTTVLIGILCMQWLREFQRDVSLPHKDAIALRQMRFEGLLAWHLPGILYCLSLLLQTALVLFFIGLLDLLWSLNKQVATVITIFVALTMLFLLATTMLPTLQYIFTRDWHLRSAQCSYKSPQSWAFHRMSIGFVVFASRIGKYTSGILSSRKRGVYRKLLDLPDWVQFDLYWRSLRDAAEVQRGEPYYRFVNKDIAHGLAWVGETFVQSASAVNAVAYCIRQLNTQDGLAVVTSFYHGVELPPIFQQPLDDELRRDLVSAHCLEYLTTRNTQLRAGLVFHRFELYIRIKDRIKGAYDTGLISPVRFPEIAAIPGYFKLQVLERINAFLAYHGEERDIKTAWYIFESVVKDPRQALPDLKTAAIAFLNALEKWVTDSPADMKKGRLAICLRHLILFCYDDLRLYHEVTRTFPELLTTFPSIVRCLNESVAALGYPDHWSPWGIQQWQALVVQLNTCSD
ncbi:hypothetical protein BDQ12DRAFT_243838 [Crucibulum laeve]|uniref:DUF6535 domain-containing protein n=1 Tax=Crucibulum laeve TaxID=68775 RepID=A0A5C3LTV3_9AGAR|nr:hypothetical protein BDQ12DRAFT_243838 [Crucibulum laeve]